MTTEKRQKSKIKGQKLVPAKAGNRGQNMEKPSDFAKIQPFNSILQNCECEVVARNIMTILGRTGNTFRRITWDEYKTERLKDGGFTETEHTYFNKVVGYCVSTSTAVLFSPSWNKG